MGMTMRVSLPGYDCLTDTNLDHYALNSDADNVLIKEKNRNTISLASGASTTITHNLGYIPFFMVFVNDTTKSASAWSILGIPTITGSYFVSSTTTTLTILNNSANTLTFKYFIFYDDQV